MRTRALLAGLIFAFATPSLAQDDLAPLLPVGPTAKPKPKPKPRPKARPKARPSKPESDDLAPLVAARGKVNVKLGKAISRAEVAINGKPMGTLPLSPLEVDVGEVTVTIKRPGYSDAVRKVKVTANKTVDVSVTLQPIAAVVSVSGAVQGADVFFNGKLLGIAPLTDIEVPAGSGEFLFRKEGHTDERQTLTLVAGKDYPLTLNLVASAAAKTIVAASDRPVETNLTPGPISSAPIGVTAAPSRPITSQWYFWAGIAAVVVAVAAGTAVGVSSANQAPTNGQTERRVCEGECYQCIPAGWCDGPVAPGARASGAGAGIVRF